MLADTRKTCEIYSKAIAAGEDPVDIVGELATWFGVQRPAILRRLRTGGVLPPYKSRGSHRRVVVRRLSTPEREEQRAKIPRVYREACQRCGVRADIGCKHSRAPVGMTF